MSEVAVIGAAVDISGLTLAGARGYPAETAAEVLAAWQEMPAAVAVVVLTETAARVLGEHTREPFMVVMPDG